MTHSKMIGECVAIYESERTTVCKDEKHSRKWRLFCRGPPYHHQFSLFWMLSLYKGLVCSWFEFSIPHVWVGRGSITALLKQGQVISGSLFHWQTIFKLSQSGTVLHLLPSCDIFLVTLLHLPNACLSTSHSPDPQDFLHTSLLQENISIFTSSSLSLVYVLQKNLHSDFSPFFLMSHDWYAFMGGGLWNFE